MKIIRELCDWTGRIHIGRWADENVWQKAVEEVVFEWLSHTPKIENATADVMSWQKAGLLIGTNVGNPSGRWKDLCEELKNVEPSKINPEHLLLAYALKVRPHNVEAFVERHGKETIPYRAHERNVRYVDTLGMVVPYLHWTGRDELAVRQMREYDNAMWNGVFPAHAYNVKYDVPMGTFDWSRGCGWYILALIESVDMEITKEKILKLAEALIPFQKTNGGYGCFIFNESARMDSSGTALIGLLMIAAYEYTRIDMFLECAKRCEKALMAATRRDGIVDFCQGDTIGIGNYSQTFSLMPFAQGMALKLAKSIEKYKMN